MRTTKETKANREALFIETYLSNGEKGGHAYLTVFGKMNDNTSRVKAHYLLQRPHVKRAIEKRRAELRAQFRLTTDNVMHELARVARFNPKRLVDENGNRIALHNLDDDTAAALSAVELEEQTIDGKTVTRLTRFRTHNKMSALTEAIKVLHLYERPPVDPDDVEDYDEMEMAKALAFMLEEQAHKRKLKQPPTKTVAGERVNGKGKVLA